GSLGCSRQTGRKSSRSADRCALRTERLGLRRLEEGQGPPERASAFRRREQRPRFDSAAVPGHLPRLRRGHRHRAALHSHAPGPGALSMTADSDDRTTEYGPPSFARPLLRPEPLPEPPEPAASGVDYWALSALVAVLAVLLAGATFLVL